MNITAKLKVGNNVTLGFDEVEVSTTCHGFLTIHLPSSASPRPCELELDRRQLQEFLMRTMPEFVVHEAHFKAS